MKKEALRVTSTIPVAPTTLYFAWIDSDHHSAMTGKAAKIEAVVGAKYSACDGYVTGKLVILDLGRRIVMSWRTPDFPRDAPDSRVEVHFETLGASTRLLILHTEIPEGQSEKYKALWNDSYVTPMRSYFSKFLPDPRNPPVRRPPPPPPEDGEEEPVKQPRKLDAVAPKASAAARVAPKPSQPRLNAPTAKKPDLAKPAVKAVKKAEPTKPASKAPAAKKPEPKKPKAPAAKKPAPKKKPVAKKPPPKKKPASKKSVAKKPPPKKKPASKKKR